jgi:hypothetical protein
LQNNKSEKKILEKKKGGIRNKIENQNNKHHVDYYFRFLAKNNEEDWDRHYHFVEKLQLQLNKNYEEIMDLCFDKLSYY